MLLLPVGKSKLDDHKTEILALLNNGSTKTWIAKRYKTTPGNLRHWLKQHGIGEICRSSPSQ